MIFDEFQTKWTGKPVDFDGIYPNQCMDLMHQYVYDVLGVTDKTILARAWAALVYTQFQWDQYFEKIANSPTGVPQKGDIILWDEALNYDPTVKHGFGHVSIFISGDANNFKSFDANWPLGSLPHVQDHNYNLVLGWLRPKTIVPTGDDQIRKDRDRNWNFWTGLLDKLTVSVDLNNLEITQKKALDAINNIISEDERRKVTMDNQNQQINDRNNDITMLNAKISTLETQVTESAKQVDTLQPQADLVPDLQKQIDHLTAQVKTYQEAEKTWNRAKAQLEGNITKLKAASLKTAGLYIIDKLKNIWSKK